LTKSSRGHIITPTTTKGASDGRERSYHRISRRPVC
jgi:hypothetical protein